MTSGQNVLRPDYNNNCLQLGQRGVGNVLAELKKRLFFWKNKPRLESLPAEQLCHIIAESDHVSAAVDSTQGLLKPEDMKRLTVLTRTLEEINKHPK
jgi:hypothetical protein